MILALFFRVKGTNKREMLCYQQATPQNLTVLVDQPASPVTSKSSHRGAELPSRKSPIALAMNDFRPLVQHHADVDLM
jgi:hypothetical protein